MTPPILYCELCSTKTGHLIWSSLLRANKSDCREERESYIRILFKNNGNRESSGSNDGVIAWGKVQQQQLLLQPPQRGVNQSTNFKSFQSVKPHEFKGEHNPIVAGAWLKEMEKVFNLVQVGENRKTDYASYFLKDKANYWRESTRALEGEGPVPWSQMEIEFLELKQGDRSVAQYEAKFTQLARFVPNYVRSEAQKARRFQQGLK
ncbi:uncharacterized protein LOC141666257 [Apium graveolens]|uniref:uncharacterized protein LOC141666257 n=1 Tax=Apium graveolens TaxID=4045 RepID=UPI003D7B1450